MAGCVDVLAVFVLVFGVFFLVCFHSAHGLPAILEFRAATKEKHMFFSCLFSSPVERWWHFCSFIFLKTM